MTTLTLIPRKNSRGGVNKSKRNPPKVSRKRRNQGKAHLHTLALVKSNVPGVFVQVMLHLNAPPKRP